MGKKKAVIKCKKCGATFKSIQEIKVVKTWHVVAPFPDKEGNITINVMAIWVCPVCGHRNRGKIASIKSNEVSSKGKSYTERLIEYINMKKEVSLDELAKKFNTDKKTIEKAIDYLIKKNMLRATKEGDLIRLL